MSIMLGLSKTLRSVVVCALPALPLSVSSTHASEHVNWTTFNANGINLGGWFVQEKAIDTGFWADFAGNKPDEWSVCATDNQCGTALERRYATWIKPCDIEGLAAIEVPGSQLYHGNQLEYLKNITDYAITRYGVHIVLDIHSLPGGVNGLDIGERGGAWDWFHNQTALNHSLATVDRVLEFIKQSGYPQHFTLEPVNEPTDNRDFSTFGTPATLPSNGSEWVLKYYRAVMERVQRSNPDLSVMLFDAFQGEQFWSPFFHEKQKIVFNIHRYYFARPSTLQNVTAIMISDGEKAAGDGKFPTFVGGWAIQTTTGNEYANRREVFRHGFETWKRYTRGSAYGNVKYSENAPFDGEGTQAQYWNFEQFMHSGYLDG